MNGYALHHLNQPIDKSAVLATDSGVVFSPDDPGNDSIEGRQQDRRNGQGAHKPDQLEQDEKHEVDNRRGKRPIS